jgi:ADP-ribose pyrophosphatase
MNYTDFEEKTISRKDIFKGHIIDVKLDEVALPNGAGIAQRELVFHNGAVCVMPITPENKLVLVGQFRKALERVIYEVPAGKLEQGEAADVQAAMLRELEEETHYTAGHVEKIFEFSSAPGFCSEVIHMFYADQLTIVEHPRPADDDEVLDLIEVSLGEAKAMIADGRIYDAKTIMAVQYWELKQHG